MSQSRRAPEEMSRDELEEEVAELRERMQTVESDIAFIKRTLVTLTDADLKDDGHHPLEGLPESGEQVRISFEDLQEAVRHHGEQLAAVSDVSQKNTEKEGKVASIAAFAMQRANEPEETVLVDVNEIRGCTGVTRRYAYKLIDDIGEDAEYEWASVRNPKTVQTSSGPKQKAKGLLVDCDTLRKSSHQPDRVNSFNTRSGQEGR